MARTDDPSGLTIRMVENQEDAVGLVACVLQMNSRRVIHSNNGRQATRLIAQHHRSRLGT